ncbi:sensor histidine kinase [Brachyspira hampsonii]|uniref:histidine kinase n=1 Tax=Brachyspira hampsonii 30446 TaxID=1289135 RepID=A0A2U4F534_9SPIR|nr:ATP-binding protein [Brachyspira hampsonii]EKV57787.1 histidine kinase [Brachyspira hampsonii 30446]MBW5390197.1 GHKL domain-containing protein [Brachyspira hampsonii]MBW5394429.1 GHKL domain-containing protein [Brachyspira hampsonii]OEJ20434.1 two-component sensor histidine kinase [Brachyspira hampsonii]
MNFIKKILSRIKIRYGILFPSLICLFTLINFIATLWLSSFIYEPNITNQFYMFSIMFFPLTSIMIGVIVIIKFIVDAIMKKEGSHLKLVIVLIMGLMTVLPSIVISKISTYIIKTNLNLFLDQNINSSVEYVMDISNREITEKQEFMYGIIKKVGINYFNNLFDDLGTGYSKYEDISDAIKYSKYFDNVVFLSNSYNVNNIIFFNSANYIPLDINYKLTNTNIIFVNSEYNGSFYVNAIIPLSHSNNYVIWSETMPKNYIEVRNNALESFRIYNSVNMFTNEFSMILSLMYIFVLGISAFFSIILGIALSRLITGPISLILNATNSITNADFNIDMKLGGVHDMRNLIHRFNVMARALKYHRDRENTRARLETWREAAIKVAHEIKNPLMPIIMNAELIDRKISVNMTEKDVERAKNSSNIIIKNANVISNLVRSFSEFSFAIKLSDEKQSINGALIEVLESFKNISSIQFSVVLSKHDYFINMDREKLIMAFRNLIKNAVEAMEKSSRYVIYISSYHEIIDLNEFFIISITDTGIGIEKNNLHKIFEPYFTSKEKGTGIGLSTVEKIISEHNGTIEVESIPNEGTTFFIKFMIES